MGPGAQCVHSYVTDPAIVGSKTQQARLPNLPFVVLASPKCLALVSLALTHVYLTMHQEVSQQS